jgi:dipeptidyl aminopeptidase/acylaminoacyl peptidase
MNDLELLLRTPFVDPEHGFDISPDGNRVAFSWNITGRWEIYERAVDGSGDPICLTSGDGAKFAPKYSPDGLFLAYALDLDGSENYHICKLDLVTGISKPLTGEGSHALNTNYSWSPDGKELAVLSIHEDTYHVDLLSVAGADPRPPIEFTQPLWDVQWSPTGDYLAVVVVTSGSDNGIIILDLNEGAQTRVSSQGVNLNAQHPAWSPDGSELAFSSDLFGFYNIGFFRVEDLAIHWLTKGDKDKTRPAWSLDGKAISYILWENGSRKLILQKLGGDPENHAVEPGSHTAPDFTPDGKFLLDVFENYHFPPDLWKYSLEKQEFTQLTSSRPQALYDFPFVLPEEVFYPGSDEVKVPAMLYRSSSSFKDLPTAGVVNIHGGPEWLYSNSWNPFMSFLASQGWTVLAPNYRGSIGYGRAWQIASHYEMGKMDQDDVSAGAQYLVNEKLVDPSRIVVTGRSHGGYLTLACMTHHPDLWAGGAAIVPFLNLFTSHSASRQDLQDWNLDTYGDPIENHDLWVERSPYFFLDRINAPVLFISGANDVRCPASDAIAGHQKLIELGKNSKLLLYPDEGHVFLKIETIIDYFTQVVEFFRSVLDDGTNIPVMVNAEE